MPTIAKIRFIFIYKQGSLNNFRFSQLYHLSIMSLGSKIVLCVALALVFWRCTKIIDLPYPAYEPKTVLSGILNPDSLIRVSIAQTLPPFATDSIYPIVSTAKVLCYENGKLLGEMKYQKNGVYQLNYKPQVAKKYRIEAVMNNLNIFAEDSIPVEPSYLFTMTAPKSSNINNTPDVIFKRAAIKNSVNWFSVGQYGYSYTTKQKTFSLEPVTTIEPYLDTFNSFKDDNGATIFSDNIRIKPEYTQNIEVNLTLRSQILKDSTLYVNVAIVSINYDKYLKSAINSYQNRLTDRSGGLNNPFYEPTNIYSNVSNGIGILGAMQSKTFRLKNSK